MTVDADLREQDLGEWNGLTDDEIAAVWPSAARCQAGRTVGGRARRRGRGHCSRPRCLGALERIAAGGADETVVVAHGGVIIALERALGVWRDGNRHPHLGGWWVESKGVAPGSRVGGVAQGRPPGTAARNRHRPRLASRPMMKVEVVRSRRRRKTVQARQVGDVLRVSVPATLTRSEEEMWVSEMLRRVELRQSRGEIDLTERAQALSAKFALALPKEIRWVDNQRFRWGSCTPGDGTVRISSRLAKEPSWVLDYVIVHELAHLHVRGHGKAFWDLVDRYPLMERARGFLIARGVEDPDDVRRRRPVGRAYERTSSGPHQLGRVGRVAAW